MRFFLRILFWFMVVVVLATAIDVAMHRARFHQGALGAAQTFYLDFRNRLVSIWSPSTIDAVIETTAEPIPQQAPSKAGATRYLYKDSDGQLQFADSLDEVPPPFRQEAQPMYP